MSKSNNIPLWGIGNNLTDGISISSLTGTGSVNGRSGYLQKNFLTTTGTTDTIPHDLGKVPKNITFYTYAYGLQQISLYVGTYNDTGMKGNGMVWCNNTDSLFEALYDQNMVIKGGYNMYTFSYLTATCTVDATNIYLTWTKTGSNAEDYNVSNVIFWNAIA